ncbi:MAG: MFS transporter [Muribaculaceae bacterium]|nr:MFS transporter [Muribaculaceae bacterium]
MIKMIRTRLAAMSFLEFAVWGSYLISLGNFLSNIGLEKDIYWFYTVQGIVSILMPAIIGIVADKWIQAQRMLSICHLIAALSMGAAGWYSLAHASHVEFGPLFVLYTVSVAFYMPTIGLSNSVAYSALNKAGLDTIKSFPPIRVLGTIGFIVAELMVNFIHIQGVSMQFTCYQLFLSAAFSLVMAAYALTMPECEINKNKSVGGLAEALGIKAFSLFKDSRMAIFFIFSFLLGVSLQITNSYGTPFISSFRQVAEFADSWVSKNATALISLSQMSETLCILLIPFCLKKFGIKKVMLMSMFAWVFRFGFFGLGNPEGGVALFVASMIVYGIAFDFFNVSGSLYVDAQTDSSMRSSAQGLFMLMTNGLGATAGTLAAGFVVNHFVYSHENPMEQITGWKISWYCFAGFALVVAIAFWLIFKEDNKKKVSNNKPEDYYQEGDPGGMVVENGEV